jgi:branched-subunit amino acid ABC-type transport system permease component
MNSFLPFIVVGLTSGSVYGLAGAGLVLTYKTSGLFNFAYGAVAAAMAFAFFDLHVRAHLAWPVALIICVAIFGTLAGLALERMARRLADAPAASKIVATLGLVIAIQAFAVIRYGSATRQLPQFLPTGTVRVFGVNIGIDQLVIMGVALAATIGLWWLFRFSRLGLGMRGVVDNAELLSLTGSDPVATRRWSWCIGSWFAALSGILLAPAVGLDATILTLLVVQAFGAAAVGMFSNLPLTYAGGLLIGVLAALSTKYVGSVPALMGLPPSVPFIVLFAVLIVAPRRRLRGVATERRRRAPARSLRSRPSGATVAGVAVLLAVPLFAGSRLIVCANALAYAILFLSLALLERTSGQVSLAQLALAAVGAAGFSHLAHGAGLPWLVAVLLAGVLAVPIGAIVAIPAIRLSGLFLALATFGFGVLMEQMAYGTKAMFGSTVSALPAPRPSIAQSDRAYYYVVLAFAIGAVLVVAMVHRSRLGRLLRAMADEQVALSTYGVHVTAIKVLVFAVSAFLAGIAGALMGPVTGVVGAAPFASFSSLLLVVVLALQGPVPEIRAAFGAATTLIVLPSLLSGTPFSDYLTPLFGVAAIVVALIDAGSGARPRWLMRADERARERLTASPVSERRALVPVTSRSAS